MNPLPIRLAIRLMLLTGLLSGIIAGHNAIGQTQEKTKIFSAVDFGLTVREGTAVPVELHWKAPGPVDIFKVLRNGQTIVATATTFCPDAPASAEVSYQVEAWRDGQAIGRSAVFAFKVPDRPIHEKARLTATAKRSGVRLSWPATGNPDIVAWRVWREQASPTGNRVEIGTLKTSRNQPHVRVDRPKAGHWRYTVAGVNAAGSTGPEANVEATYDPNQKPSLLLDWPLTARPVNASVNGEVTFTKDGAVFKGGYLQTVHQPGFDMDTGLTVEFEFRDESTADMPVLISHGLWRADGWFIQRLGGGLVARTSVGDSPSFAINRGRWYRVRMAYAGLDDTEAEGQPRGILSLDGKIVTDSEDRPVMAFAPEPELNKTGSLRPVSIERPLVIGQYNAPGPDFQFQGTIRNLKIWDDYLENKDQ